MLYIIIDKLHTPEMIIYKDLHPLPYKKRRIMQCLDTHHFK